MITKNYIKTIISILVIVSFAIQVGAFAEEFPTCSNCSDDYPFKVSIPVNCSGLVADIYSFYYGQCTSFVAWRMNRDHPDYSGNPTSFIEFKNLMSGVQLGNAENWDSAANQIEELTVSNVPVVGAIAQWDPIETWHPIDGHVAYVAEVDGENILIEEYNWPTSTHACGYNRRWVYKTPGTTFPDNAPYPSNFIIFNESLPTHDSIQVINYWGRTMCYDNDLYQGSTGPWTTPYDWDTEYREGDFRTAYRIKNTGTGPIFIEHLVLSIYDSEGNFIRYMNAVGSSSNKIDQNINLEAGDEYRFDEAWTSFTQNEINKYNIVADALIDGVWYNLQNKDYQSLGREPVGMTVTVTSFPLVIKKISSLAENGENIWEVKTSYYPDGTGKLEASYELQNISSQTVNINELYFTVSQSGDPKIMSIPDSDVNIISNVSLEPGGSFSFPPPEPEQNSVSATAASDMAYYNFSNSEGGIYDVIAKVNVDGETVDMVSQDLNVIGYPVLASIQITGWPVVSENSGGQYTCTAHYADGTTANVSGDTTWTLEGTTYASLNNSGYLTTYDIPSEQYCRIRSSYGGMYDLFNVTIQTVGSSLQAPYNLTASKGTYTDHIAINWSIGPGTDQVSIQRKENDGSWISLGWTDSLTSYTDNDVDLYSVYYYKVRAHNTTTGDVSPESNEDSGFLKEPTADEKTPQNVTATNDSANFIQLTCDWMAGLDGWKVYRSESVDGVYSLIKDYDNNQGFVYNDYSAEPGIYYYYKLTSYGSFGESPPSSPVGGSKLLYIGGMSPTSGDAGDTVTIMSQEYPPDYPFGLGANQGSVFFGSTPAAVTSWSSDQIIVTVPEGNGTATVTITSPAGIASINSMDFAYPSPTTLTSLGITGPTEVEENSGVQYNCTAIYSDGSSVNVNGAAEWSEDSSYAAINNSGYLTTSSVTENQPCRITFAYTEDDVTNSGYLDITIFLPSITIITPNGGESFEAGSTLPIEWETTGTVENVIIEYSTDNGSTWTIIEDSILNNSPYPWTVPDTVSNQCLVRIGDAADGEPSDESDAVFSIVPEDVPGPIKRVSIHSDGITQGDANSIDASISGDGRFVAFASNAGTLVDEGGNGLYQVFVNDRSTGQTELISKSPDGELGNDSSREPSISGDGRYVTFHSSASNIVTGYGSTHGDKHVFLYDRQLNQTYLVSISLNGEYANSNSTSPKISPDGGYIVFDSESDDMVTGDTNLNGDVFCYNRATGQIQQISSPKNGDYLKLAYGGSASLNGSYIVFSSNIRYVPEVSNDRFHIYVYDRENSLFELASIAADGTQANQNCTNPSISADGNHVVFSTSSSTLVPEGSNGKNQIFLRNRSTNQTELISKDLNGGLGNDNSFNSSVSEDGRYITFESFATNLTTDDTNGIRDIFVYDRQTGKTCRVSALPDGIQGNGDSSFPLISSGGGTIAFHSSANNLVTGDTNGMQDVFTSPVTLCDTETFTLTVQSTSDTGVPIIVSPGDNNGNGDGSTNFNRTYEAGTTAILTAPLTHNGKVFIKWTVDGQDDLNASIQIPMNDDHIAVAYYIDTPTITVLSPNGGESWEVGSIQDITWETTGTVGNVMIEYSHDNGVLWTNIINSTSNDGIYPWLVSGPASDNCLVRISETDGDPTDTSDAVFLIIEPPTITVISPNGGENREVGSTHNVTWTSSGLTGNVTIDLYKGGDFDSNIGTADVNSSLFPWTLDIDQEPGSDYTVRISQGTVEDYSDNPLTISTLQIEEPEIKITHDTTEIPDGGSFNFGDAAIGNSVDETFTIENTGNADLILSNLPISIIGNNADQFSVIQQPTTPLTPSGISTFIIRFAPSSQGTKTAAISIDNNDSDENLYEITLNGTGTENIIPAIERSALIALYNSTNGDSWTDKSGWKTEPLHTDGFAMPGTEGTWKGITVTNISGEMHLTHLELSSNNLSGNIPAQLGNLSQLIILRFFNNQLTGNIPPELGNLNNLKIIDLGLNPFDPGPIPNWLDSLLQLERIRLDAVNLNGTIPGELSGLSRLIALNLSNNTLEGNIPPGLGSLVNLEELLLYSNQLTGEIPDELANLTKLRNLDLESNQLSDTFPDWVTNLTDLWNLNLGGCDLTGTIPLEIGNLTNLITLVLSSNKLTGTVPGEICQLAQLNYLNLSNNDLSGDILTIILCLDKLQVLYLFSNEFTGSIPNEFGNLLSNLTLLHLGDNRFSGNLPSELGNLFNLKNLFLQSNIFIGEIPVSITNLTDLESLDIGYNALNTDDNALKDFLNEKDPDWETTQTVAPSDITVSLVKCDSIQLNWTPIIYTQDEGNYKVFLRNESEEDYTYYDKTADKTTSSIAVTGLTQSTTYYFKIQTCTELHSQNKNTVCSEPSNEVSGLTPFCPPSITVNSPNGGEIWEVGSTQTITWSPVSIEGNVIIEYSPDGGNSYNEIESNPVDDGSYNWIVPDTPSDNCLVRISSGTSDDSPSDTSDEVFSIVSLPSANITVTSPNGSESWEVGSIHEITWTSFGFSGEIKIEYSIDNRYSWTTIVTSTDNDGNYKWIAPNSPSNNCFIRISRSDADEDISDVSNAAFSIVPASSPIVTVISPNGGEHLTAGTLYNITWASSENFNDATIEFSGDNGTTWTDLMDSTPDDGIFEWTVPDSPSGSCLIRISDTNRETSDVSDAVFSIVPPSNEIITITSPNGGESWEAGSSHEITWGSTGTIENIIIEYSTNNGASWIIIVEGLPDNGSYNWTIPDTPSEECLVRISGGTSDEAPSDTSDTVFSIASAAALTLMAPNGEEILRPGENFLIQWKSGQPIEYVKLEYSPDNGSTYLTIEDDVPNSDRYVWQIPHHISSNCLVRVSDADGMEPLRDSLLYEFKFKIIGSELSPNDSEAFIMWLGDTANEALTLYIPKISFICDSNGNGYIKFNEVIKEISTLPDQWQSLKVLIHQETQWVSLWLNSRIIFENLPLLPGSIFAPVVSLSVGSGSIEVDNFAVEVLNAAKTKNSFITVFEEDFENFQLGDFPEKNGWESIIVESKKKCQAIYFEEISPSILIDWDFVSCRKVLTLQPGKENQVFVVKYFNIPEHFPFDISDKQFSIVHSQDMETIPQDKKKK